MSLRGQEDSLSNTKIHAYNRPQVSCALESLDIVYYAYVYIRKHRRGKGAVGGGGLSPVSSIFQFYESCRQAMLDTLPVEA